MNKIIRIISDELKTNYKVGQYNSLAAGWLSFLGHPFYWFIWTYIFPHHQESAFFRFSSSLLGLGLILNKYWPEKIKKYLPFYWYFFLVWILPTTFTYLGLKNNFTDVWIVCEIMAIFFIILFNYTWVLGAVNLILGSLLGALFFYLSNGAMMIVEERHIEASLPTIFVIFAGVLFAHLGRLGASGYIKQEKQKDLELALQEEKSKHLQDKAESLKSLAGSIAHELRNPLNTINLAQTQVKELLSSTSKLDFTKDPQGENEKELIDLTSSIGDSVIQANNTINIILADLGNKPIEPSDFSYLSTDKILPQIIKTFGYRNLEEKTKVKLNVKDNFIFKAIDDRFVFIVYNLLKNALYYLNQYPDSVVTVGAETRSIDNKEYNSIYVHDTGPGIPPHILPKLFGDFFTSGKKDGTGLGLSFCKRNMKIFDGDIIVESELAVEGKNGWTKFSLLFPKLSEEEIKTAETIAKRRKVLIVDDQQVNLITAKSKIEKTLINISCDIAISGKDAIRMARAGKYHLIIMDIQMPEMNGVAATKEIRKFNKDVPIIAYTSLCYNSFLKETNNLISSSDFNCYLSKSTTDHVLYRTITKWIIDTNDDFSYLGSKEKYLKNIQGKNILLADDGEMNLMMTRKNLERNGLKVTECKDGKELLEIYKNSLDENNKSNFDMIITDVNMPPYNGDEASKEIRAIELNNHLKYENRIPIIALSGDGQRKDIYHFFSCGMTDYFIKGCNPELLVKILANYLVKENDVSKKDEDRIIDDNLISDSNFEILNQNKIKDFSKEDRAELLQLFLRDSNESLEKIKQNKKNNNIEQIHFFTHRLKGIVGNIGAERLFEYTKNLDLDLKQGKLPVDFDWLNKLEKIYEETIKEIKKIMDE